MIEEATQILASGRNLDGRQMFKVMQEIMAGNVSKADIISFLNALSIKGESVEELTAAAQVMRRYVTKIEAKQKIILDTCGTGADRSGTFNISTVSAFVASGCSITVAKHGNRSVSSRSGSADILEALGININLSPEGLKHCLNEVGIAFLFAQNLHPAMKYAMPARKEIGKKTIFNILGPLTNPAGATHQLIGVYDASLTERLAQVLNNLGTQHALVVHGEDGLDEITTTGKTSISELCKGKINNYQISPEDFGFKKARLEALSGGAPQDNAGILLDILQGKAGPKSDIVLLNAGAAIYTAEKAGSIKEGIKLAVDSISSGRALKKLEELREFSNR